MARIASGLLLLVLGAILVGGGCRHVDAGASISADDLRSLVLQPADLPSAFVRFDEGRQVRADLPGGARSDATRFGRLDGWKARYRRAGSPETSGPLVIESRADLFESGGGAERELEAHEGEAGVRATLLRPPRLGEGAFAATMRQGGIRFFLIGWRQSNVTASVFVNGFEGRLTLEDALALARKQQQRLARAAG